MRNIVTVILLTLSVIALGACGDELVEEVPDAQPRTWATAGQAVVSECSALCRWEVRCEGAVLESCETNCHAGLCAEGDCDMPPAGSDALIDSCASALFREAASVGACTPAPLAYSDVCREATRPAYPIRHTWRAAIQLSCSARCARRSACGASEPDCEYACENSACDQVPGGATCEQSIMVPWADVLLGAYRQGQLSCRKALLDF